MESRRKFMVDAAGLTIATAAGVSIGNLPLNVAQAAGEKDTNANLMDAFAGESQANRRYLTFADQAEKEGFTQVAMLFRAIAAAETIHAKHHLRTAGKVGNTMENLNTAMEGEIYETTTMYPEMAKTAANEGNSAAQEYFEWADKVEAGHAELYKKAIAAKGKLDKTDYYLCSVCGYTHEGKNEGSCPVCGSAESAFFKYS